MKTNNGPTVTYELVYRFFPRMVFERWNDGFYHEIGRKRGILIKSVSLGNTMYLEPKEVLLFKCDIKRGKVYNETY